MSAWEKWKKRPQNVWLRRALFQVHLWTGIGLGIYILLMSVTGSALVFRREMVRSLAREPRVAAGPGARMNVDELGQAAKRAYPEYDVTQVFLRKNPDEAAEITLERRDKKLQRLFNPYTGADLGDSVRFGFRFVLWLADLHDNLLLAQAGRLINAAGGIFTMLLVLTGAVIWWPGIDTWGRSLSFRWKTNPKGFNWTLHSALGFWTLAFSFMWAVTGIYLSIPTKFNAVVDFLEPLNASSRNLRFGDLVLSWLAKAHFGRFADIWVKIIWTVVGLAPAVLFLTGMLMWWKRVLKPWLGRKALVPPRAEQIDEAARSEHSIHARS
ncbi:MAG TPA: PepSY-associated TM helix domain-containing protein [Candidatus Acidoferrum sp.]|nr:PepSY-associated TM helix domain-containing protein [Candidatus Acidoferrum sp.]